MNIVTIFRSLETSYAYWPPAPWRKKKTRRARGRRNRNKRLNIKTRIPLKVQHTFVESTTKSVSGANVGLGMNVEYQNNSFAMWNTNVLNGVYIRY